MKENGKLGRLFTAKPTLRKARRQQGKLSGKTTLRYSVSNEEAEHH